MQAERRKKVRVKETMAEITPLPRAVKRAEVKIFVPMSRKLRA